MKKIITFKFAEQNPMIHGPAVDRLVETVRHMYGRGAPVAYDDIGFNKIHYSNPILGHLSAVGPGEPISVQEAVTALSMLVYYKKRQVPDYDQIKAGIEQTIKKQHSHLAAPDKQVEGNVVQYVGNGSYGKEKFYIPGLKNMSKLNTAVMMEMRRLNIKPEMNRFRGATELPVYKGISKFKQGLDQYEVHPTYIPVVANTLEENGYDVSQMRNFGEAVQGEGSEGKLPGRMVQGELINKNQSISLVFNYDPAIVASIKQFIHPSKRKWDRNNNRWILQPQVGEISPLVDVLKNSGYNTNQIEGIFKQYLLENPEKNVEETAGGEEQEVPEKDAQGIRIQVRDVTGETGGRWHVGVRFLKKDSYEGETLKEILRYSFINFGKMEDKPENANRSIRKEHIFRLGKEIPVETVLAGSYRDYIDFYTSLRNRGYDTTELVKILQDLIKRGVIDKGERSPGTFDGYTTPQEFVQAAKQYEQFAGFELKDYQEEGIGHLYTHESSYLGDATGLGKTIQSAIAADLRLKQSGGRALLICPLSVKPQWMRALQELVGAKPEEISDNPFEKKKWTVMHYDEFSAPSKRAEITLELIMQGNSGEITVGILDEAHYVKNGEPKNRGNGIANHRSNHRTFNIQDVFKFIPFKWGLSATIAANKPMDVYNQLRAIGHKLGMLPATKFKKEFGGMKLGVVPARRDKPPPPPVEGEEEEAMPPVSMPRGGAGRGMRVVWQDGTFEEQFAAIQKLKEYMIDQRVYLARTYPKGYPKANKKDYEADINTAVLYANIARRMAHYQGNEPINAMTAFRTEAATIKAPVTAHLCEPILRSGKKVAIFTNFEGSRKALIEALQSTLNQIGGGRVVHISGGQNLKQRQDAINNFKDLNSDARAIVINIAAGGTGLDFPNIVDEVFVNDFDWSPARDKQAQGRFLRINSENDINITYTIAGGTEDEEMYEKVKSKIAIADQLESLTQEQMNLLLRGHRRGRSSDLEAIEGRLKDITKKALEIEQESEGEDREFEESIRKKIELKSKQAMANNWYKKA